MYKLDLNKKYYRLITPEGEAYLMTITEVNKYAKENNLNRQNLAKVVQEQRKICKGHTGDVINWNLFLSRKDILLLLELMNTNFQLSDNDETIILRLPKVNKLKALKNRFIKVLHNV